MSGAESTFTPEEMADFVKTKMQRIIDLRTKNQGVAEQIYYGTTHTAWSPEKRGKAKHARRKPQPPLEPPLIVLTPKQYNALELIGGLALVVLLGKIGYGEYNRDSIKQTPVPSVIPTETTMQLSAIKSNEKLVFFANEQMIKPKPTATMRPRISYSR